MSSIKPPDGRSSPIATGTADGSSEPGAAERAGGPSFREALDQAGGAERSQGVSAGATAGAATADPISELAQAVRAGALSPEQAIERLVDRAVSAVGSQLSQAERAELGAVLRSALQSDPALSELRDAVK
jgi:hypothetical protein